MKPPKPPGPNLDELNARIAEADEWGNTKEADFARWQREWVKREFARKQRRKERDKGSER